MSTDSEGLKLYLFITVVLISTGLIYFRNKLIILSDFLYRKATDDPRKSLFITFSYFMILLTLWQTLEEVGKIFRFLGVHLSLAELELKNPLDVTVWILALIPVGAVAWLRLDIGRKIKQAFDRFKVSNLNWGPALVLVLYGFSCFCFKLNDFIYSQLSNIHEIKNYFDETGSGDWVVILMVTGSALVSFAIYFCFMFFYLGLWKRWRNCFGPYFYLSVVKALSCMGIGAVKLVEISMSFSHTQYPLWPHILNIAWRWCLNPLFELWLAWLFYHWEWFEPAKMEKSAGWPGWISESKYWWRLFWILGIASIGNFFLNVAYLFHEQN